MDCFWEEVEEGFDDSAASSSTNQEGRRRKYLVSKVTLRFLRSTLATLNLRFPYPDNSCCSETRARPSAINGLLSSIELSLEDGVLAPGWMENVGEPLIDPFVGEFKVCYVEKCSPQVRSHVDVHSPRRGLTLWHVRLRQICQHAHFCFRSLRIIRCHIVVYAFGSDVMGRFFSTFVVHDPRWRCCYVLTSPVDLAISLPMNCVSCSTQQRRRL